MFLTTEIAQILPGGLIWPTLQSEKKTFGGQKKRLIPYFQAPLMTQKKTNESFLWLFFLDINFDKDLIWTSSNLLKA